MSLAVVSYALATALFGMAHPSRIEVALSYILGALFLPAHVHFSAAAFPLNSPSWSLSCEVGVNGIWAITARWLSNRALAVFLAIAGAVLVVDHRFGGDNFSNFVGGWERVCWSFPAGILLHRAFASRSRSKIPPYVVVALAAILVAVFAAPSSVVLLLGCSMLLFPTIVWVGAHVELRGWPLGVASWAGAISYALYITHAAVGQLMLVIFQQNRDPNPQSWLRLLFWTTIAVLVAWALDVAFDVRVRAVLGRAFLPKSRPSRLEHR